MKSFTCVLAATAFALQPVLAHAEGKFATVETSTTINGEIVTGSIYASENEQTAKDSYIINGVIVGLGRTMPVEVHIPADVALELKATQTVDGANLTKLHAYEFKTLQTKVVKSFYQVDGAATGKITVTDEPIPLIAWLIVAGVSIMLVPAAECIVQSDKKLISKLTLGSDFIPEVSLECVPAT
ncbi:hypothetical protein HJB86_14565 [Rhizobium sp. NZLR3b]|uniref:hypothetical protein n=1 Tax=Rhizobium sp. NZLR3b TaxID=2731101 RepID=UPI001C83F183|nr:hypothetical protein [Rhizobium sp. NZLR3b]MBX5190130.1 hypothetical protein [Rhizobium sp. NZLR3b]